MMLSLHVTVFGSRTDTRIVLPSTTLTVGRSPVQSRLVIDDPFVSAEHAVIRLSAAGEATVTDLASTNGTFLHGERLAAHRPQTLLDGDMVSLAGVALRVRQVESDPAGPNTDLTG
jgi:pSer/pThr/pTyr-binding forkhead associated (FHA) protein